MNDRSQAISILQSARDLLGERLTQRIIEARQEIESDARGNSYLSEIETIYEQLGGRLAHLNAMLTNLPPASAPAGADAAASEIIYADLASAYPTGLDLEGTAPLTLLALPAPGVFEERSQVDALAEAFQRITLAVQAGDLLGAGRMISECFDFKPSQARRSAVAFARQLAAYPELARRVVDLGAVLEQANEQSAAALLAECFEFHAIEAIAVVRAMKLRLTDAD
jgi:hypothetical protein